MTLESWLDADDNRELCRMAGDLAWDTLAGYHDARDLPCPVDAAACIRMAEEIAFSGRRGWEYAAADANDPAGEIARKIIAKIGFRIAHGSIGFDAVLTPT